MSVIQNISSPLPDHTQTLRLSVVVIAYRMARQVLNTVYSLSVHYQRNAREQDYEIIVVENHSDHCIDVEQLLAIGNNIRYVLREETGVSPAAAINVGLSLCRAPFVGLLIDGARMLTPRVIDNVLMAQAIHADALVAVPGYQLGSDPHHLSKTQNYNEQTEQALLEEVNWKQNGYRLFDIANISEANPRGVFQPFMECNCLFTSPANWQRIGGADEAFHFPGGGGLNLHFYRSLGVLKEVEYFFILQGEGSFHQYHGGVSTTERHDREEMLSPPREQLESYWNGKYKGLEREPILLGAVDAHAQRFLQYASERAMKRFARKGKNHEPFWVSDLHHPRYTEQFP
jgi:glycosyltransferase involved in cell wall biosynthesis